MQREIFSQLKHFGIALMVTTFCLQTAGAAELRPSTVSQSLKKPISRPAVNNLQRPAMTTFNLTDYYTNQPAEPINPLCAELNQLAISLGERPPKKCNPSSGSGLTHNPQPEPEPESTEVEVASEPVLFVHGFSATAVVWAHNCEEHYWAEQKKAVKDVDSNREVKTIGWYTDNIGCDVDLYGQGENGNYSTNTPNEDVAEDLYNYIKSTYTMQQISVDIVAHSLGGLVVRKMLDDWGDELWVSDVVTLATPHDGVKHPLISWVCWLWWQCTQSLQDSDFINDLEHNPQSAIGTKWTLIAAADDGTIGDNTATVMDRVSIYRPAVSKFSYEDEHKHRCEAGYPAIGHGDVHSVNGTKTVYVCNEDGDQYTGDTEDNPTSKMLDALFD